MARSLITILASVVAVYVGLGLVLYLSQRSQQYFPHGDFHVPADLRSAGVDLHRLETPDGETIAVWYRAAPQGRPTILYFHGNGGSVAHNADRFRLLVSEGFGLLAVSYRGYPGSSGSPSEKGLATDALTAFDWLIDRGVSADDVIIYGWSLGSGVAAHVASARTSRAMIMESPFTSALSIARMRFPVYPVGLLMKDPFRTDLRLPAISGPLVVLHGTDDIVVPVEEGRKVFADYEGPKLYLEFPGGRHEDLWDRGAWPRIRAALVELGVLPGS